jgi:putative endopeptidase
MGRNRWSQRWKRVINRMQNGLGQLIGRMYVEKYFAPESKARMQETVANLKLALRSRIQDLTWMENSTKVKALNKLNKTDIKVGYPDKWKDYSGLKLKNDSYVRNTLRTWTFEFYHGDYGIDKIGKPVDRNVWELYPQEVNAGEDPLKNILFFPAGILQPPFFNKDADDAINYGAIGTVIGHEMTHGFDDQGRKYDQSGNLTDWWTKSDEQKFNESTRTLVDEYNKFQPLPGLYINGNLILGENIADFGGLTVAHQAYKLSQKADPERIDGFTGDQRFFLGFAQLWRESIKDEMLRMNVQTDCIR